MVIIAVRSFWRYPKPTWVWLTLLGLVIFTCTAFMLWGQYQAIVMSQRVDDQATRIADLQRLVVASKRAEYIAVTSLNLIEGLIDPDLNQRMACAQQIADQQPELVALAIPVAVDVLTTEQSAFPHAASSAAEFLADVAPDSVDCATLIASMMQANTSWQFVETAARALARFEQPHGIEDVLLAVLSEQEHPLARLEVGRTLVHFDAAYFDEVVAVLCESLASDPSSICNTQILYFLETNAEHAAVAIPVVEALTTDKTNGDIALDTLVTLENAIKLGL